MNTVLSRRIVGAALGVVALALATACGSSAGATNHHSAAPIGATQAPSGSQSATATYSAGAGSQRSGSSAVPTTDSIPTTDPVSRQSQSPPPAGTSTPPGSYADARQVVEQHGYDPVGSAANWHTDHRLNAIVGVLKQSTDGTYQRVFFFVNGHYIGLDSTHQSGSVQVVNTSDDLATVTYGLFAPSDALCCPSSHQSVRFQWNGSALTPLDPIPPVATGTTTGR